MRITGRVAIVAAFATVALSGTALAGKAGTEIKNVEVLPGAPAQYSGEVASPDKGCEKGRKVKITHLSDPPFPVGSTKTDKKGNWELEGPFPPNPNEKIEIKVSKTGDCKGDKLVDEVSDLAD